VTSRTAQRPVAAVSRDRSKKELEMSLEETETTVRQYLDALLNGGDFAAFFDDEVLWTTMETGDEIHGREAVRDFIIALHSQLFDASPELVSTEFADGVAGLEAVFVGTHIAEFAGVPATGAAVRLPYSMFYAVSGGRIVALRAYFPITALLQQLREAASAHV
jgi:steroid delta-isomerase-like uncharacterized protein